MATFNKVLFATLASLAFGAIHAATLPPGLGAKAAAQPASPSAEETPQPDAIEYALDYLLGRNGKTKDPQTGLRLLFLEAKQSATAQKVFLKCWSEGLLKDGFSSLSEAEFEETITWMRNAYQRGEKWWGLGLGIDAYYRKQWPQVIAYWQGANSAESWHRLGNFYNPEFSSEENWAGPDSYNDERLAIQAYRKCLALAPNYANPKCSLAYLLLDPRDQSLQDIPQAHKLFAELVKSNPYVDFINLGYAKAGYFLLNRQYKRDVVALRKKIFEAPIRRSKSISEKEYKKELTKLAKTKYAPRIRPYLKALERVSNEYEGSAFSLRSDLERLANPSSSSWFIE